MEPRTPLLEVAEAIVAQIDNLFTLISLGMTCTTFRDIVFTPARSIINARFDELELDRNPADYDRQIWYMARPNMTPKQQSHYICEIARVYYAAPRRRYYTDQSEKHRKALIEKQKCFDIVKYGGRFWDDSLTLPCYGCRQFKCTATDFFHEHKTGCRRLLGCNALTRRCIDCKIERYDYFENSTRYLLDMPKGYTGYRLCCQVCNSVQWVRTRPRKVQEIRRVCDSCLSEGLSAVQQRRPDRRRKMITVSSSSMRSENNLTESSDEEIAAGMPKLCQRAECFQLEHLTTVAL